MMRGIALSLAACFVLGACGNGTKPNGGGGGTTEVTPTTDGGKLAHALYDEIQSSRADGVAIAYAENLKKLTAEEAAAKEDEKEDVRKKIRSDLKEFKMHGMSELTTNNAKSAFTSLCKLYGVDTQ